jgi:hypothetical protein
LFYKRIKREREREAAPGSTTLFYTVYLTPFINDFIKNINYGRRANDNNNPSNTFNCTGRSGSNFTIVCSLGKRKEIISMQFTY